MSQATPPEFSSVLQMALSLPAGDQRQLLDVMVHVAGPTTSPAPRADLQSIPTPADTATAEVFIASIAAETPWDQLQLIDGVLADMAEDDHDRPILLKARKALLDENTPLSVRRAVVTTVSQQPAKFIFGICGLALAVIALGQALWRIVF